MLVEPEHRSILAFDIEGFGRPERTNPIRLRLRRELAQVSANVLRQIGMTPSQCAAQDTGDGIIYSIDGNLPKVRLLDSSIPRLSKRLQRLNRDRSKAEQLRLRVALHAGEVVSDPSPLHGDAVILASRLLDADVLRACLRVAEAPLALIVSPTIYQEIVRHGYGRIRPDDYYRTLVHVKETRIVAWLHVPEDVMAPHRARVVTES
jgi:class 3 adenylate cyclase